VFAPSAALLEARQEQVAICASQAAVSTKRSWDRWAGRIRHASSKGERANGNQRDTIRAMTKRRNRGQRNQGGAPTEAAKVYASGAPRKRSLRAKLLLSAVAVVMTLLVAEIAFRTYYFFVGSPTHITFGATSEEWRRLWIERHQNKGVDIYHGYNRYDPRLGWALKPDLQAYKVGDYPAVTTNSQGWRADRDFPVAKPEMMTVAGPVSELSATFCVGL
jgi:hypothetical protein